jgi:hypothetical protein
MIKKILFIACLFYLSCSKSPSECNGVLLDKGELVFNPVGDNFRTHYILRKVFQLNTDGNFDYHNFLLEAVSDDCGVIRYVNFTIKLKSGTKLDHTVPIIVPRNGSYIDGTAKGEYRVASKYTSEFDDLMKGAVLARQIDSNTYYFEFKSSSPINKLNFKGEVTFD